MLQVTEKVTIGDDLSCCVFIWLTEKCHYYQFLPSLVINLHFNRREHLWSQGVSCIEITLWHHYFTRGNEEWQPLRAVCALLKKNIGHSKHKNKFQPVGPNEKITILRGTTIVRLPSPLLAVLEPLDPVFISRIYIRVSWFRLLFPRYIQGNLICPIILLLVIKISVLCII